MRRRFCKTFTEVHHELLSQKDVGIESYFNDLGRKFVLKFMSDQGFTIPSEQLTMTFPFSVIAVRGYEVKDKKLDFDVNVGARRLQNMSIQGTTSRVDSMTFDELKNVIANF